MKDILDYEIWNTVNMGMYILDYEIWNTVNMGMCQIGRNTTCCGWGLKCYLQISPGKNQISADSDILI
jgi:hypothetical protein